MTNKFDLLQENPVRFCKTHPQTQFHNLGNKL